MRRLAGDVGTATAELAVAVPAVGVLLSAVVAVAQAGVAQVEVVDAARAGARAAARGDDLGRVRSVAADAASGRPGGSPATVDVGASGAMVRVTVSRRVRLVLRRGPSVKVSASAVALRENGSATVLVLAVAFVAVVLATLVAGIGSVAVSRHRAASAADLGALAAADVLVGRSSGSPCAAAATVVAAAGAALAACRTAGSTAEVVATVRPVGLPGRLGPVRVRARAGPSPYPAAAAAARSSRRLLVSRCGCRSGRTRTALGRRPGPGTIRVSQVATSRARSKETRPNRAGTAAVGRSGPLAARLHRRSVLPRRGPDGTGVRAHVDVRTLLPDQRPVRGVVRCLASAAGPTGA
jgi:secretion/DNA translocation related TadE-like protein